MERMQEEEDFGERQEDIEFQAMISPPSRNGQLAMRGMDLDGREEFWSRVVELGVIGIVNMESGIMASDQVRSPRGKV